jgi:subtilisin family serine protease
MANGDNGGSFPPILSHPTAGRSSLEPGRIAIRWRPSGTDEERDSLLAEAGLAPVEPERGSQRPAVAVNRTRGLWWVRRENEPVPADLLARLEKSDLVEWVSPAYRAEGGEQDESALFVVNPTRLYVRQQALDAAGGVAALPPGVALDSGRSGRLPGLAALRVEDASAAEGRTAVHVAAGLGEKLARQPGVDAARLVRFENIPYLSPAADCRPPTSEFSPDDPMFADQWGLQRVEAPRAWEIVRGDPSVTVAVLDEGVELDHPDLALHPQSWNASTDTPDGSPAGDHGTACAGIVAARLDNAQGVAGMAGGARVMAIATATWADVDIAEGLYFAADNGARVVSMSFGVYPSWNFWDFDLIRDALQYAHDQGLVLVAASGNEDWAQSRFPGSDGRTLCVGGNNRNDERKRGGDSSSEPWWGASYGPDLDVVAPCLEIPTTDRLGGVGYAAGDYYDRFNGTSAATPHVAGLAALMLSLRPSLSNVEVRSLIEETCDKISPNLYSYANVTGKPSGTWNEEVGYGRVNAERALLAACAAEPVGAADCRGCGGECTEKTPEECRAPAPLPWLDPHRCMFFYEARVFDAGRVDEQRRVQLRISYQHCLRLLGRGQGGLLYTTTLLPGEAVRLYEYDRYRRVRSQTERLSVHSSFRQTLSALSQTRRSASASAYVETITEARSRSDTSVSAGGGLAGFFGAPTVRGEFSIALETTVASGASLRTVSEQFTQNAVTSAQSTDAERSLVVSRFEDAEHQEVTSRTLRNDNECYAVTYYVRRVNEVYDSATRLEGVEWRVDEGAWRSLDDTTGLPDRARRLLERAVRDLPRRGEDVRDPREITLPTDGTLYEAELAHCSSCEPPREEAMQIRLEQERLRARRACLEAELLALELQRRQALAETDDAVALDVVSWPLDPEAAGAAELPPAEGRSEHG